MYASTGVFRSLTNFHFFFNKILFSPPRRREFVKREAKIADKEKDAFHFQKTDFQKTDSYLFQKTRKMTQYLLSKNQMTDSSPLARGEKGGKVVI